MTNVKLNYILICDQAFFDEKGKTSIIGTFNRIESKGTPAIHPKFTIVVNIMGDKNTSHIERIEIINLQDNKTIAFIEKQINFKDFDMHNFLGNFVNTIFPTFGKYWIKISIDHNIISKKDEHYILVEKN